MDEKIPKLKRLRRLKIDPLTGLPRPPGKPGRKPKLDIDEITKAKQRSGPRPRGKPTSQPRGFDGELVNGVALEAMVAELMGGENQKTELPQATPDSVQPPLSTETQSINPCVDANNAALGPPADVAITPAVVDSEVELARKAMAWFASGKALSEFCAQPGAIGMHTMIRLLRTDPLLREEWKLAQSIGADALFHDIIRVADYVVDPNKARVMIDARKYVAGRLRPELYSEKTKADVEVGITINVRKFGE